MFICLSCSAIHRNIPQVSKVKSIRLDAWEEAQVEVWPGGRSGLPWALEGPFIPVLQAPGLGLGGA